MSRMDALAARVEKLEAEVLDLRRRAGLVPSPWCHEAREVEGGSLLLCQRERGHEGLHRDHAGFEWPRMTAFQKTAAEYTGYKEANK